MIPLNDDSLDKAFSSICENVLIEKLETDLKELTEKLETLTARVATLEMLLYNKGFSGYVSIPSQTSPVHVGDVKWGDINFGDSMQTYPSGDFYTSDHSVGITADEYAAGMRHTYEAPWQNSTQPLSGREDIERR